MAGLGGSEKIVVGHFQFVEDGDEVFGVAVGLLLGGDAGGGGGLLDFEAVLVGSGEEEGWSSHKALETGGDIGEGGGVEVSDVWSVVDVVDGGCDIE